ncbi:helix-turn-helix transcriptional regulator [Mycobacterium avium subsp. hominissuis]|uniref:helix-turn-helix domain-containing protein n=1 Tax=Mycobacterium avium TaxID=1764 RepID=UPI001CC59752|nr:helix-turn-helix domain-containing protein [Mycobacterium avium]MBZ4536871.1 helix-turn-helix transcriptional regulator [Mycobacterium avium subsp. hominissuis]
MRSCGRSSPVCTSGSRVRLRQVTANECDEAAPPPPPPPPPPRPPPPPPPGLLQEAAREVFAERGYEATTREIALRAGVSHKLIFRYFDSKENCSSTQS